jgi:hypothetical protein
MRKSGSKVLLPFLALSLKLLFATPALAGDPVRFSIMLTPHYTPDQNGYQFGNANWTGFADEGPDGKILVLSSTLTLTGAQPNTGFSVLVNMVNCEGVVIQTVTGSMQTDDSGSASTTVGSAIPGGACSAHMLVFDISQDPVLLTLTGDPKIGGGGAGR